MIKSLKNSIKKNNKKILLLSGCFFLGLITLGSISKMIVLKPEAPSEVILSDAESFRLELIDNTDNNQAKAVLIARDNFASTVLYETLLPAVCKYWTLGNEPTPEWSIVGVVGTTTYRDVNVDWKTSKDIGESFYKTISTGGHCLPKETSLELTLPLPTE